MNLYLIRHGQSEGNLAQPGAPHDPPLTEIGHAQAERVAEALAEVAPVALYASPMTRALQTATPAAEKLELVLNVWPDLAETARMEWNAQDEVPTVKRGLTLSEVKARYPRAEYPGDAAPGAAWWEAHTGERREQAYARAARMLAALDAAHPGHDEPIAVITHGAFGSVLMSAALGTPPTDYNRYSQYNCAISLVHWAGDMVRLRYLNRVEHLPEALRTDLT